MQVIVTWVGIAGGLAGIGFPAYSTHKQDQAALASERQQAVHHAQYEQAERDRLWQTLDKFQRNLDLLNENLPVQQKKIARAVFAQMHVQQELQPMYDKSAAEPAILRHGMKTLNLDGPEASTTSERNPQ